MRTVTISPGKGSRKRLAGDLKRQMLSRDLRPGMRLPTYDEMQAIYGTSRATLLQVISDLKRDGFVVSQERQGLYVAPMLPCDTRFGLLFQLHESSNRFWSKLAAASTKQDSELEAIIFRNLEHADTNDWHDLKADLFAHRLGGVIFTHSPENHDALELVNSPDIPKVMISDDGKDFPNSARIHLDLKDQAEKVVTDLTANGAGKIACITMGKQHIGDIFRQAMQDNGIPIYDHLIQSVPRNHCSIASNLIQLMLHASPEYRPDGLYIADDNLTQHIIAGLVEHGVQASSALRIVSHCNLPETERWALPIRRIGFSCPDILHHAMMMARDLKQGKTVEDWTCKSVFEDEL